MPKRLLVLLVAALLVRMAFSVLVVGWRTPLRGDEIDYHTIASNLSEGNGFTLSDGTPTARRPPAYPLFLSAMYKMFGERPGVGRAVQILLGVLVVYLTYSLGVRYFSESTAFIAAVFTACNPFLIFISGYLLTENLYLVLLLASMALLPFGSQLWAPLRRLASGAFLLALVSLTRPSGFSFTLWVLGTFLLLSGGPVRRRIARAAVFAVVWLMPFFPWMLRNQHVFGEPIWFTTHGGITFYQGNNPAVRDIPRYHGGVAPFHSLPGYAELRSLGEVEKNHESWRMGKTFVRENWRDAPVMAWRKFLRFWRLQSDVGISGIESGWWWSTETFIGRISSRLDAGFLYAIFVIPLFLIGLAATIRAFRAHFVLYGVIVVHTFIALVFFGSLRGRIPVEPVIAMFASAGLLDIIRRLRKPKSNEIQP